MAAMRLHEAGAVCGHGTDNVRDEAAWLACHALGLSPVEPLPNEALSKEQLDQIENWVQQRIDSRQPTAYLTGSTWFAGYQFRVTEAVLVPRSPLAEMIQEAFSPWADADNIHTVLDLCTGSGCIGIATALVLTEAQVDLADISDAALTVAQENINRYDLASRVRCIQSDFFSALGERKYDLILTNPPYVPTEEVDALPDEYLAEPRLGLESGDDGLNAACIILTEAAQHLNPGGLLVLEVGGSWERLQAALPGIPLMWLEFCHGGDGVLVISRDELIEQRERLADWRQQRQLHA